MLKLRVLQALPGLHTFIPLWRLTAEAWLLPTQNIHSSYKIGLFVWDRRHLWVIYFYVLSFNRFYGPDFFQDFGQRFGVQTVEKYRLQLAFLLKTFFQVHEEISLRDVFWATSSDLYLFSVLKWANGFYFGVPIYTTAAIYYSKRNWGAEILWRTIYTLDVRGCRLKMIFVPNLLDSSDHIDFCSSFNLFSFWTSAISYSSVPKKVVSSIKPNYSACP